MTSSKEKILKNFSENLRYLRISKKFTQKGLAIKVEISQDMIYYFEHGMRTPSIDSLCRIADVLGVEPYELLKEQKNLDVQI